jgi:hypothetical protein
MNLDKFYTKIDVVKKCILEIEDDFENFDIILEPSAGCGNFLNFLPLKKRLGIDIDPVIDEIVKTKKKN